MQPVEGGREKQVLEQSVPGRAFVVEDDSIYYLTRSSPQARCSTEFYRFTTGRSEAIARIEDHRVTLGLTVSPDRKYFVCAGTTLVGQNLMLVDGFR
jgi:hypothetical protein